MLLTLRIWLWRARPSLLALGAVALVLAAARVAAPPPAPTEPVVVTAREVPAGGELTATDLVVVRLPSGRAPVGASGTVADWVGRRSSLDLPAGLPLVPSLLVGERFTITPPAGSAVVAVPLEAVDAVRPGDRLLLVPTGCTDGIGLGEIGTAPGTDVLVVEVEEGRALVATDEGSARRLIDLARSCDLGALLVE